MAQNVRVRNWDSETGEVANDNGWTWQAVAADLQPRQDCLDVDCEVIKRLPGC